MNAISNQSTSKDIYDSPFMTAVWSILDKDSFVGFYLSSYM